MTEEKLRYKYESEEAAKAAARKQRHKWDMENYERTTCWFRKGMNEKITAASEKLGKSKRGFINDAIEKEIKLVMGEE